MSRKNKRKGAKTIKKVKTHEYVPAQSRSQQLVRQMISNLTSNIEGIHCMICGNTEEDGPIIQVETNAGRLKPGAEARQNSPVVIWMRSLANSTWIPTAPVASFRRRTLLTIYLFLKIARTRTGTRAALGAQTWGRV